MTKRTRDKSLDIEEPAGTDQKEEIKIKSTLVDLVNFPEGSDLAYLLKRHPLAELFLSPRSHGLIFCYGILYLQQMTDDLRAIRKIVESEHEQQMD